MIQAINTKYKIIFRVKNVITDIFCKLFFLNFPNKWSMLVSELLGSLTYEVKIKDKSYKLLSNNNLLLYRSKTFSYKEPETNKWVENIPSDGVFYDVGANVGVYTILASAYCRRVYAFEPVALNYSVLSQNLLMNNLDKNTVAYCIAISDKSSFDTMRLSSTMIGSAHHSFGVDRDACHNEFSPVFKQGSFGVALDDLVYSYNFECPTYLKIDVDGNEHLVIGGATKLLKDSRLKSILIELNKNLKIDQGLVEIIKDNGFNLTEIGEEASFNGMKIGNLIFFRN